jgi:RNA polymerase sigma-70 factor (ECF subfamily)
MNVDVDLITACIRKERKAQYEMYKQTHSYLMAICVRYTRTYEDAQEALNNGFLKMLNNLEKYKTNIPFKTWVRRLMVNVLIDEYRKYKKHNETMKYVEDYSALPNASSVNSAIAKMDAEQIQRQIAKLPVVSQRVFNMYVIDGFNHREIGDMLGISEGTSKWHLHDSRERLKVMLAEVK